MEHETAGDPMTGLKWTRRTTEKIARELVKLGGIEVSANTVGRILKELGYSLRVNHKKIASGTGPERDAQFRQIAAIRDRFSKRGLPVISVDTKKKELVGNFKNPGTAWNKQAVAVKDHDFRSQGLGLAVPYGIYDIQANRGSVFVGASHDTPQFAVSSIEKWWRYDGRHRYTKAKELLILADCGGSNGYRCRAWKHELQQFSNRHRIKITVSHYPPGTSKWNPIEHRLFSAISKNWAGCPLDSFATIKNYISTTLTTTGLAVKAYIDPKIYAKGIKINVDQMNQLNIRKHDALPNLNYTFTPL
jgi:Rhodopirellula transposase DDE domain